VNHLFAKYERRVVEHACRLHPPLRNCYLPLIDQLHHALNQISDREADLEHQDGVEERVGEEEHRHGGPGPRYPGDSQSGQAKQESGVYKNPFHEKRKGLGIIGGVQGPKIRQPPCPKTNVERKSEKTLGRSI
jgi:hypothetical protein